MSHARAEPDGALERSLEHGEVAQFPPRARSALRPVVLMPDGGIVEWPAASGGVWSGPSWPARFDAAARLATMVYPGPVGELLERELRSGLVCAGRFGAEPFVDEDALLVRVVEHVLGTVERRAAVTPANGPAGGCVGSRAFRPFAAQCPSDPVELPVELPVE